MQIKIALGISALLTSIVMSSHAAGVPETVLAAAGGNRTQIERALKSAPEDQRAGMAFLVGNMPDRDLRSLSAEYLLENCRLAYQSRVEDEWARQVPEDIFLNNVLPYASINEQRERWRGDFRKKCLPIVRDANSLTEAATLINRNLFTELGVKYSTKRARADQSPSESINSGLASCTGLSILLIDACRSVGIPARFVGTPMWTNMSGNHSWVEIWDDGWHFTGAAEPTGSELDRGWFIERASKAKRESRIHAIFAVSFKKTPQSFPFVWDRSIDYVSAVNVTDRYVALKQPLPEGIGLARFTVRNAAGERMASAIRVKQGENEAFSGFTNNECFDTNDHLSVPIQRNTLYSVIVGEGDDAITREIQLQDNEQLFVFQLDQATKTSGLDTSESKRAVETLRKQLADEKELSPDLSDKPFAGIALTKQDADAARQVLAQHRLKVLRKERAAEMETREIVLDDQKLKFDFKRFGKKPAEGWSLYISMHGGGGGPVRMNDGQWENQKRLYELQEGIYVAPRAPTNTWNMWHQAHIDPLFDRLIENMVALEDVNWDRVYVLGYSAGGDGVYQLAPRMADRFAAVAMMAGHPNETSPLGLRNLPFALQVGGKDTPYKRNEKARLWETELARLRKEDPQGYEHFVKIYPNKAHWMDREDAVAIPWMASHKRNATPTKLVWKQDDVTHGQFYWLGVDQKNRHARSLLRAEANGQTISLSGEGVSEVVVRLDDRLVDLDKPVTIVSEGQELYRGVVPRTIATLAKTLAARHDPNLCFPAEVNVSLPEPFPLSLVPEKDIPHYIAKRCDAAPTIDGKLDEAVWEKAAKTDAFVDLISGEKTLHRTQAAMAWDDDSLYIGFWISEPNVEAKYKKRDDPIYYDNDVEVFIAGKDAYYEFEINAFGTLYEAFFVWEDAYQKGGYEQDKQLRMDHPKTQEFNGVGLKHHPRGKRIAFLGYDFPKLRSAVQIKGTLNDDRDVDEGWTVELAFPWQEMKWLAKGDGRSLPPKPGDQWRIDLFRFNKYKAPSPPEDSGGWALGKHAVWDSHIPEIFPIVTFASSD